MKRPTEAQLEFPLLTIVYDPLAPHPVTVELQMDWGLTGEVQVAFTNLQSLKDTKHLLEFVVNDLADVILEQEKRERRAGKKKDAPPF